MSGTTCKLWQVFHAARCLKSVPIRITTKIFIKDIYKRPSFPATKINPIHTIFLPESGVTVSEFSSSTVSSGLTLRPLRQVIDYTEEEVVYRSTNETTLWRAVAKRDSEYLRPTRRLQLQRHEVDCINRKQWTGFPAVSTLPPL